MELKRNMFKSLLKYFLSDVKFVRRFVGGTWYLHHNDVVGSWWDQEIMERPSCGYMCIITEKY